MTLIRDIALIAVISLAIFFAWPTLSQIHIAIHSVATTAAPGAIERVCIE